MIKLLLILAPLALIVMACSGETSSSPTVTIPAPAQLVATERPPVQTATTAPPTQPPAAPSATARPAATVAPPAPAPTTAAAACPQGCQAETPTCRIKGNINAEGVKIYHVPGGGSYTATVINPANGERWFCTGAEAVANGWRAAQN